MLVEFMSIKYIFVINILYIIYYRLRTAVNLNADSDEIETKLDLFLS